MNKHVEVGKIVGIYALFGCLWILFSDNALGVLFPDPQTFTRFAIFKGIFFIAFTSLLLAVLLARFVTRLKQSSDALRENQQRLDFLVKNTSDSLVILNSDGSQRYVSPAAERITGFPIDALQGKTIDTLIHPDDLGQVMLAWDEAVRHPERIVTVRYRHIHKTRGWVYSEAVAQSFLGQPPVDGVVATVRDITERKAAEEAIFRKDALLKAMLRNLPFDFWARDTNQRIIMQSDESIRLWGDLAEDETVDWQFDAQTVGKWRDNNQQVLEFGKMLVEDCSLTPKDGVRRDYHSIVAPIREGNTILGILGINIDITERNLAELERKALQAQLIQAQKMEAIGTLAGGIAHDFNNLLAAILGYAELARSHAPAGLPLIKDIDRVLEAGERAASLVKQILAFSRQDSIERVPLELVPLIKQAIKLLRPALPATIAIQQHLPPSCEAILADPTQMHQVLMNLCTNAFHAMEQSGGTLTIEVRSRQLQASDLLEHPQVQPGHFVELIISDTGTGIAPEIRGKIFDPYFTTKGVGKGTGMGLAITHGIVTAAGGFITCDSEVGQGTTFTIYFPAVDERASPTVPAIDTELHGHGHILLVDDEPLLVELGQDILEQLGYTVTTSRNGFDALALVHQQDRHFDALITDQTMPGMTGMELAAKVLALRPQLPIILCTGFSSLVDEQQAKQCGVRAFLMKPFRRESLASQLCSLLPAAPPPSH